MFLICVLYIIPIQLKNVNEGASVSVCVSADGIAP